MTPEGAGEGGFPLSAGIVLGLGLGGFFDGIVFHQILQWHHMMSSARYPPDYFVGLRINTFFDGLFHAGTYILVLLGLALLWKAARKPHPVWSGRAFIGSILMGFGIFNLVEGIISHHLLDLHHVNETVPRSQWITWDIAFLVWGAAMLIGGLALLKSARRRPPAGSNTPPDRPRAT